MTHRSLTEFLLARIAEDEASVPGIFLLPLRRPHQDAMARRVAADCKAKRRIVEVCKLYEYEIANAHGYDDILKALASVYADHPDYREEWRT